MAKARRKRHGKRGWPKGRKHTAKHNARISAGLKRAWRAGKFKGRKHRGKGGRRKRRGVAGSSITITSLNVSMKT